MLDSQLALSLHRDYISTIPVGSVKFVISGIASIAPAMDVNRTTPTETAAREMLRQFVVTR
jgi:hypothetical protein